MRVILVLAAAMLTAPAFAQAVPATAAAQAPTEKKACRYETPIGSTIPTRICRTKAQWKSADASDEASSSRFQQQGGLIRQQTGGSQLGN